MSRLAIDEPSRVVRSSQIRLLNSGAKVGGTSGFTLNAANNIGRLATVAASQTGAKLVMPIPFMKRRWGITAFYALGQIESAGNAVTWDLELRKLTAAAADIVDASVASATQLSVTADTQMDESNTRKALATIEYMDSLSAYYLLATATTLGSTDIDLIALAVEFQER